MDDTQPALSGAFHILLCQVLQQHFSCVAQRILLPGKGCAGAYSTLRSSRRSFRAISLITWMEVMAGTRRHGQEAKTGVVMGAFEIIDVSREIAERGVLLREKHGMKLPDAIIFATAQSRNCPLISRNTKDFAGIADVISPYHL